MADLNDKDSALTVKIVGTDSSGTETNFIDATANGIKVDGSAVTQPISAASLPLPTGASTAANQSTANTSLASIDSKTPALVSGRQPVDGSGVTQPISAVSLPLPTGAATSANQATEIASLASIDSKTPALVAGRQPVDGSGVTQPISAAALPLPTGAATAANQATEIASLASIDAGIPAGLGQTTMTNSMPVVIASDQTNVPAGISITNNYTPTTPYTEVSIGRLKADPDGQLLIRGDVLTDEGTFRDDFSGNNISNQRWTSSSTGNSSISVANSFVTLNSGTGNNNRVSITAVGDYCPISFRSQFSVSQRIANQTIRLGFADNTANPAIFAQFSFTGTDNTVVDCVSASSSAAADLQTTTIKIPNGTSATSNDYYIEVQPDQVTFIINGFQVAQHKLHIPGPYDVLNVSCFIQNATAVTATTAVIDYIYFINQNALQVTNSFDGDPSAVKIKSAYTPTYSAAITGLATANTATDIFTITGSATKTVKIKHLSIDGTQTTAGTVNVLLIKRSTANTAGTSTTPTAVALDSLNPAATATVRAYTANPTLGTTVGTIHNEKLFVPTAGGLGDELRWESFNDSSSQEITLRGTSEVLAINLNSTTVGGGSFNIDVTWTEE